MMCSKSTRIAPGRDRLVAPPLHLVRRHIIIHLPASRGKELPSGNGSIMHDGPQPSAMHDAHCITAS